MEPIHLLFLRGIILVDTDTLVPTNPSILHLLLVFSLSPTPSSSPLFPLPLPSLTSFLFLLLSSLFYVSLSPPPLSLQPPILSLTQFLCSVDTLYVMMKMKMVELHNRKKGKDKGRERKRSGEREGGVRKIVYLAPLAALRKFCI